MIPISPSTKTSYVDLLSHDLARGTAGLPLLPRGAREALKLAQNPDADFDSVAKLAEQDPPLAARVLAVANSALYSRGVPISSVSRALVRLGMQATRDVLYQAVYAAMLFDAPGYRELVAATFRHGVIVGHIARHLSARVGTEGDTAYLAGLLHDVGEARCWKHMAKRVPHGSATEEVFAAVHELHTRAGAELAALWKLPPEVGEACLLHHAPEGVGLVRLVAAADRLARRVEEPARSNDEDVTRELAALGIVDADEIVALLDFAKVQSEGATVA